MNRWRIIIVVTVLLGLVAAGCGGGADTPTNTNLVTNFDVTPHDDVQILEERIGERIKSADQEAGEYRFNGNVKEVLDLAVGDPVVIPEAGFGIVASVAREGGETVLQVNEATLGDIIQDGTLEWDYDVSWTDVEFEFLEAAGAQGPLVVGVGTDSMMLAQSSGPSIKREFSDQGWKIGTELKLDGDKLKLGLTGSYGQGNAQAVVSGDGFITGFNFSSLAEFAFGEATDFTVDFSGLQGEMEIEWHAFRTPAQALTEIAKFRIPIAVKIPVRGPYGIPLDLKIAVALRVVPELSALDSSSGGKWKVTYSADQGFGIEDPTGPPVPKGLLLGSSIDTTGETVTAGQGPAGFGVGLEFPRFELGFAGSKTPFVFVTVDMYSTSLWTPGTLLTGDIPPCQYGYTKLSAVTGYSLKLLGMDLSDQYTLWEDQVNKYLDGEVCTLSGE